jgi:hypothetical protein
MRAITLALGLLAVAFVALPSGQIPGTTEDSPSPILTSRFLHNTVEPLTQFRAVRRLEARNQRFKKHGWMDVLTELSPEGRFSFEVLAEGGSSYIRKKVLLPVLEGEREIVSRGDGARSALTTSNYAVTGEGIAGSGLVRLTVKPLRQEMTLVEGALFVTDTDADLVRIEGRLAKNPSFWTRRVDIVRHYGRVGGVRVPLCVESVAHIRIAGRSELTMTYQYEMVNGHVVASGKAVRSVATEVP